MKADYVINAEIRADQGKGASRRLRRAGKVPAVLYGGHQEPAMLQVSHTELAHRLENEAFYSHIITVKVAGDEQQAVLKDLQRHPARPVILHLDLQRVLANEAIRMHVPLHYKGEEVAPGVKEGGVFQHQLIDVEIECLPKDLPEFIEVDVSAMKVDEVVHLSQIKIPEGVKVMGLAQGDDPVAISLHIPRAVVEEEPTPAAEAAPVEGAEGAAPVEGAKPGEAAAKPEAKKDEGKKDEKK
ncbi:MAG: 50S ribosomal protein L25/general stress protein Ctc [Nevskiales bacterium]